jgi:hypothetical protein
MLYAVLALAICGVLFAVYLRGQKAGKTEVKSDIREELLDDIEIVTRARDGYNRKPSVADKLRSKYTRRP